MNSQGQDGAASDGSRIPYQIDLSDSAFKANASNYQSYSSTVTENFRDQASNLPGGPGYRQPANPGGGSGGGGASAGGSTSASGATYTVVSGDTLSKIASRFGTTYQTLASINGIPDPNKIKVGQIIKLPAAAQVVDPTPTPAAVPTPVETPQTNQAVPTAAPTPVETSPTEQTSSSVPSIQLTSSGELAGASPAASAPTSPVVNEPPKSHEQMRREHLKKIYGNRPSWTMTEEELTAVTSGSGAASTEDVDHRQFGHEQNPLHSASGHHGTNHRASATGGMMSGADDKSMPDAGVDVVAFTDKM